MANKVTPNTTNNKVIVTPQSDNNVTPSITNNRTIVNQSSIDVVRINTLGPQGPTGPPSDPFPYTGSAEITGSLEVKGNISGSNTGSFKHLKATTIEGNSPLTIRGVTALGIGTDTPTRPFELLNTSLTSEESPDMILGIKGDIELGVGDESTRVSFKAENTNYPGVSNIKVEGALGEIFTKFKGYQTSFVTSSDPGILGIFRPIGEMVFSLPNYNSGSREVIKIESANNVNEGKFTSNTGEFNIVGDLRANFSLRSTNSTTATIASNLQDVLQQNYDRGNLILYNQNTATVSLNSSDKGNGALGGDPSTISNYFKGKVAIGVDNVYSNAPSLTHALEVTGDTRVSGIISASSIEGVFSGDGGAHGTFGSYDFGYEIIPDFFPITGSGLIIDSPSLPSNHYNMIKLGNVEMLDLNSVVSPNTFYIHNVDSIVVASGSEPVDITDDNPGGGKLFEHTSTNFKVYSDNRLRLDVGLNSIQSYTDFFTRNLSLLADQASNPANIAVWSGDPNIAPSELRYVPYSTFLLSNTPSQSFEGDLTVSGNLTVSENQTISNNLTISGSIIGLNGAEGYFNTYDFGYEIIPDFFPITGSGLFVSSSNLPANHYNMIKLGNIEMLDLDSVVSPNTFYIHNVDSIVIASGSEPVDITDDNPGGGKLFEHTSTNFKVYSDNRLRLDVGLNGITSYTDISTRNFSLLADSLSDPATVAVWNGNPDIAPLELRYTPASTFILSDSPSQTITGDLTVGGKLTAQEFHTEIISSSILYESGSTKFGDSADDTHEITGSVLVNGTVSASTYYGDGSNLENIEPFPYTGSAEISGSLDINDSLNVGPTGSLTVTGSINLVGYNKEAIAKSDIIFSVDAARTNNRFYVNNDGGFRAASTSYHFQYFPSELSTGQFSGRFSTSKYTTFDSRGFAFGSVGTSNFVDSTSMMYIKGDDDSTINYTLKTENLSGNPLLIVRNDGNVGIGTTSPDDTLHVVSNVLVGQKGFTNPIAGGIRVVSPNTSYGQIGFSSQYDNFASGLRSYAVSDITYARDLRFYVNSDQADSGNGDEAMRLDHEGNLGIGTTSPSEKLHVSGNLKIDGIVTGSLTVEGSGSTVFEVNGSEGQLFSITDSLSGSLFAVSDVSGLPILEVFSDDRIVAGAFNQNDFVISGSRVGIGTATPSEKLHVVGNVVVDSGNNNMFIGNSFTGDSITGADNIAIGPTAMRSATATSTYGIAIGSGAGRLGSQTHGMSIGFGAGYNGAFASSYLGSEAGKNAAGQRNVGIGYRAGGGLSNGVQNLFGNVSIGYEAGRVLETAATAVGYGALTSLTTGTGNTALGYQAGTTVTTGVNNTLIGYNTDVNNATNSGCTIIGTSTIAHTNASNQTGIGYGVRTGNQGVSIGVIAGNQSSTNQAALGYRAGELASGTDGTQVGKYAGRYTTGGYNTLLGSEAGQGTSGTSTFSNTTAVGYQALTALTTGAGNTALGYQSGDALTTGNFNTVLGQSALGAASTTNNAIAIGAYAADNLQASDAIVIGKYAGRYAGAQSVLIGNDAGRGDGTSTFSNTVAVGHQALTALTTGGANTAVGYLAGKALTTGYSNESIGYNSLASAVDAGNNVSIGQDSLNSLVSGDSNIAIGRAALYSATGDANVGIGQAAVQYTTGISNVGIGFEVLKGVSATSTFSNTVAVGYQALTGLTTGTGNTALGYQAGSAATTQSNGVLIGRLAGGSTNFIGNNVFIGNTAGQNWGNGDQAVAIGNNAAGTSASGQHGVFVGAQAGAQANGTDGTVAVGWSAGFFAGGYNNVLVGKQAGYGSGASTYANATAVGYQTLTALTTGGSNTAVGYRSGFSLTESSGNTLIGYESGRSKTTSTGRNVAVGHQSLYSDTTGYDNTAIGYQAIYSSNPAYKNVGVGFLAGTHTTGNYNTLLGSSAGEGTSATSTFSNTVAVGYQALTALTTGIGNTAVGYQTLSSATTNQRNTAVGYQTLRNNTSGNDNTAFGFQSLIAVTSGNYNTAIGFAAGDTVTTGSNNTLIGHGAGSSLSNHSGNVMIGYNAGYNETSSNKLYIDNSNSTTPLIYGEFDNDIVRVNGTLQVGDPASTGYAFPTSTGTTGQVLEVNASGDLAFATPSGGSGGGNNILAYDFSYSSTSTQWDLWGVSNGGDGELLDPSLSVTFTVPSSGKVEVETSCYLSYDGITDQAPATVYHQVTDQTSWNLGGSWSDTGTLRIMRAADFDADETDVYAGVFTVKSLGLFNSGNIGNSVTIKLGVSLGAGINDSVSVLYGGEYPPISIKVTELP